MPLKKGSTLTGYAQPLIPYGIFVVQLQHIQSRGQLAYVKCRPAVNVSASLGLYLYCRYACSRLVPPR